MTFHDLTRELRWIEEAEEVIRELESEQPDGEELTVLNELRLTVTEARERLALV